VTHLAADLFFVIALLAAAVAIHLNVQAYWTEIMLALKGEWNGPGSVKVAAAPPPKGLPVFAGRTRRAAF